MIKVKSFFEPDVDRLDQSMNKFFESVGDIEIVDVKYALAHEAIAAHTEYGVYPSIHYSALVIYKET